MEQDYNTKDGIADQQNCDEGGTVTIHGYVTAGCKYEEVNKFENCWD